jgi:hypothetical protein
MTAVLERTEPPQATALVRSAVARMQVAPRFLNKEEWNALASYEGLVVSGDPKGLVPDNLEADDNE